MSQNFFLVKYVQGINIPKVCNSQYRLFKIMRFNLKTCLNYLYSVNSFNNGKIWKTSIKNQ